MRAIAVAPMAMPTRRRRTNAPGSNRRIVEAGCSSRTVTLHADTMNSPRQAASIRYSGQCFVAAEIAQWIQVRSPLRFVMLFAFALIRFAADILVTRWER